MADFKTKIVECTINQTNTSSVVIVGDYVQGVEPIFVERVVVEGIDQDNNVGWTETFKLNKVIDPVIGEYVLAWCECTPLTGGLSVRAKTYYTEIEEVSESTIVIQAAA